MNSILGRQKWESEMQTYKKDGSTYWTATVALPYRNEAGIIEG
ncbi:MAG: hypothetical protein QM751_14700 [Paludibacteraceae bacterium]